VPPAGSIPEEHHFSSREDAAEVDARQRMYSRWRGSNQGVHG